MPADGGAGGGVPGASRLTSYVERIERLNEDKRAVTADLGEVFGEAKGDGFDVKILRIVVRRRAQDPAARMEEEALVDLYEAHLAGTKPKKPLAPPGKRDDPESPGLFDPPDAPAAPDAPDETPRAPQADTPLLPVIEPDSPATAREKGCEAAKTGAAITTNPYRAGDANRIRWDEGWCAETGTDGMDVPDAWKRKGAPKKPGEPK